MTRKQALALNERYYETGKTCKNGHKSKRFTHNGVCYECCQLASSANYHKNKRDPDYYKHRKFNATRTRAARAGIPFDLEPDDIVWNSTCPVFGFVLDYGSDDCQNPNAASLDKVDPTLGYVKGNVRVVSMRANWLKQDATVEQLEQIARYMREHFLSRP